MSKTLAIVAPHIGALSETFIRRHMEKLLPENTVVIAGTKNKPYAGHWDLDCPQLILNQLPRKRNFIQRLYHKITNQPSYKKDIQLITGKKFLQKHKVDVIMGEYLAYTIPWLPIAKSLGISIYPHAHGSDISSNLQNQYWREKYKELTEATGIITINQPSCERLINLGIPADKLHIIPYGTDIPTQPCKRESKEVIKCLTVGRMVPKKAPILVLDAFRRASEHYFNLHLDYIGTGPLLAAVRQYIVAFNLTDKVTLHLGQPSSVVHQLMQEADIFLQHSMTDPDTGDEEGLPVAILEAMGNALPVISTKHAGIPEAVQEGKTGFLVNEGDSTAMAEKIINLAKDYEFRVKLGYSGWQTAREKFTWERERKELCDLIGVRT